MKNSKIKLVAALVLGSTLFSSCIGPFRVTTSMWEWNKSIGDKFLNEVVFLALHIVPVYEVVYLADVLIFNTIDFWGGNAFAMNETIKTDNANYKIASNDNGYTITNLDNEKSLDLVFEKETKTWSIDINGESTKLMTLIDDSNVKMYLPDGKTMDVELSQAGFTAFKQVIEGNLYAMK
ncbi:MAG: DUF3332 domain-containing protein [Bacteroidales bacterium]|nr:DUF3332 domain-containing protein [Bacteroidales bacterium]